jgi:hypothetical protein
VISSMMEVEDLVPTEVLPVYMPWGDLLLNSSYLNMIIY